MKQLKTIKNRALVALGVFVLGLACSNAYSQDSAPCPFSDDAVIFYGSPHLFAQACGAAARKCDFSDEIKALEVLADKADGKIQSALNEEKAPRKQLDFLIDLCKKEAAEDSTSRALVKSYVKCVDYVVLALELPESVENAKVEFPNWLSLTLIFNTNPGGLDPRNYFDKNDVEIIREDNDALIGKLLIKDRGEVKAQVFFGGAKIKDVDKYAIVASASLDKVEKKISRFQQSNEFVVKNLADGVLAKRILKRAAFEQIVKAIDESKNNDDRVRVARGVLAKVESFTSIATNNDNGFIHDIVVETVDDETAQSINDLASGGLAAVKLAGKNKEGKKVEEELGLELLDNVSVTRDGTSVKAQVKVDFEWVKKVTTLALEKNGAK